MEEWRIMMIGTNNSNKLKAGNLILGGEIFKTGASPPKQSVIIEGRRITIINAPYIFDVKNNVTEKQVKVLKAVKLALPGPHVFLLVIKIGQKLEGQETSALKWIRNVYGEDALRHTLVLFTTSGDNDIEEYRGMNSIDRILNGCGERYCIFDFDDSRDHQVDELLEKIEELTDKFKKPYTGYIFRPSEIERLSALG